MPKRTNKSKVGADLVSFRWKKTTRAQRSAHAKMMIEARWKAYRKLKRERQLRAKQKKT